MMWRSHSAMSTSKINCGATDRLTTFSNSAWRLPLVWAITTEKPKGCSCNTLTARNHWPSWMTSENSTLAGLCGSAALIDPCPANKERYLPRADAAGVDLGVQGIDQPVQWVANLALMEGALSNLLDNALRYGHAPQGSSRVTVSVSVLESVAGPDTQNQTLEVSVTDNGPGLSLQERQQLMQRGVRGLHAKRLGQGAGLGLAIVSKFAQVMHARFELSPAPEGQGLCATLSFKRDPRAS